MTELDPSNYSRESTSTPYIYVRFRGTCTGCGTTVQSTPRLHANSSDQTIWARCRNCGSVTRCEKDATANDHGTDR